MTDDELLDVPKAPTYPDKIDANVRSYDRDLRAAIDECLSKYVAESCYSDAKNALEGAQDAFDGLAGLVDDLDTACRALDDHAVVMYDCAYSALCRLSPDWRDEIMLEKTSELA